MSLLLSSVLFYLDTLMIGVCLVLLFVIYVFLYYRKKSSTDKSSNRDHTTDALEERTFSEQERARNEKIGSTLNTLMQEEKLYLNPNLTITYLSRAVGTNNAYMSAYLNNVKRQNFSTYINSFRLEYAEQLLLSDPTISIEDVCSSSGFNSIPSFQRIFHNKYGCSPGQYRQQKIKEGSNVEYIDNAVNNNKIGDSKVPNPERLTSIANERNFISAFETRFPGKIKVLTERFPSITHKEKILCMLIIQSKTPDEICSLMDISPGSLNVFRCRLRKKLNLSKKDPLNKFLKSLSD